MKTANAVIFFNVTEFFLKIHFFQHVLTKLTNEVLHYFLQIEAVTEYHEIILQTFYSNYSHVSY